MKLLSPLPNTFEPRQHRLARRPLVIGASAMLFIGCADVSQVRQPTGSIRHPVQSARVHTGPLAAEVERVQSASNKGEFGRFPEELRGSVIAETIGQLDGPEQYVFGEISSAKLTSLGNLLVLDSRMQQLRMYSRDGGLIASAGGSGHGPGEFVDPQALALDGRDHAYVVDRRNRRVSIFEVGSTQIDYVSSYSVEFDPLDICILGDHLYVHGTSSRDRHLIHVFSRNGEEAGSFGRIYNAEWILEHKFSRGKIACVPEASAVVYVSSILPDVLAFSQAGDLLWVSRLKDFKAIRVEEMPGGAIRSGTDDPQGDGGYHITTSLVAVPGGRVVIQVGYLTRESMAQQSGFARVETYLFSAASGNGVFVTDELPEVSDIKRDLAIGSESVPFPRLYLLRF